MMLASYQSQTTTKGGDAYYTGIIAPLVEMVRHVCCTQENVMDNGNVLVEIGYSLNPADGWADWGAGRRSTEAWRFALGAWLA